MVRIWIGLAIERRHCLDSLVSAPTLIHMRFAAPLLSNPAFWTGLAGVPVMVLAVANDVPGFAAPLQTWESVIAASGLGLALAGPVAAAGAAVAVATARGWRATSGIRPTRMLWQRVLQRVWPAWLAVLVGYGICLALVAGGTAPLANGDRPIATLVAVIAATAIPAVAGGIVGGFVTSVLVGPLVLIGGYAIAAFGLVGSGLAWLGVLGGTWIPHAIRSLDEAIAPGLLIAPPLLLAVLLALLLFAGAQARWLRLLAVVSVGVVGAGALALPVSSVQPPGSLERSGSALVCAEDSFELCLWPEVEPDRAEIRTRVTAYDAVLEGIQLPRPSLLTPLPTTPRALRLSTEPGETAGVTAVRFGESYVRSLACVDPTGAFPVAAGAPETMEEIVDMHRASGTLAVALGGDPALAAAASGWSPDSGVAPLAHLRIDSQQAGLAAFIEWADALPMDCGVASAR